MRESRCYLSTASRLACADICHELKKPSPGGFDGARFPQRAGLWIPIFVKAILRECLQTTLNDTGEVVDAPPRHSGA